MNHIDLNLLRLFSAVYRSRSVTKAAHDLNMAQPAASHGLARLRKALGNALFERCAGGVQPTPYADRLAPKVEAALAALEQALTESRHFDPRSSERKFTLHMSDIGESKVLPALAAKLRSEAPRVRLETQSLPHDEIANALNTGRIDFAFGALPFLGNVQSQVLSKDSYQLVVRRQHELATRGWDASTPASALPSALASVHFAAVSTQADTTQLLLRLGLASQLRLTIQHFTALPAIVRASDLAAIVPLAISDLFDSQEFALLDIRLPTQPFDIFIYWSRRSENDAAARWFKQMVVRCIGEIDARKA
jgi:DNA-binding transcriptional LysR family regulator